MQQLSCIYQNYLFLKFLLYERQKCQYCSLFCRISILCGRIPYLSLFVLSLAVLYLQNQYSLQQDSISQFICPLTGCSLFVELVFFVGGFHILVYLSSHWLFSICRISILCGRIPYLSLFVLLQQPVQILSAIEMS